MSESTTFVEEDDFCDTRNVRKSRGAVSIHLLCNSVSQANTYICTFIRQHQRKQKDPIAFYGTAQTKYFTHSAEYNEEYILGGEPCSLVDSCRCVRGTYGLHIQGRRVKTMQASLLLCLLPISHGFPAWLTLPSWNWRPCVPPIRRLIFTGL
jgi:hypothetical protein